MDDLNFRYKIAQLIANDISGTISDEDRRALLLWINASSDNQREYEQIISRLKEEISEESQIHIKEEWKAFKKNIPRRQLYQNWWYGAAAVLLIGLAMFFFYTGDQESRNLASKSKPKEILKEHKAILVLSDGRRMSLSDDSGGVVLSSSGLRIVTTGKQLQYQQEGSTKESGPEYNTLIIPRGADYELRMPDGTVAWLNSGSSLTYPVNFDGDMRRVKMEGEVCFDVAKRVDQPFMVSIRGVSVKVLGTLFNVDAYPGEPVTTTLVKGKLEVSNGDKKQIIKPDQQVVISPGQFDVKHVYADEFVAWTKGIFSFTNTSLDVIMDRLARWYDVQVVFSSPAARRAKFSLEIKRFDNISEVLSKVEKTGRVSFRVEGRTVIVEE